MDNGGTEVLVEAREVTDRRSGSGVVAQLPRHWWRFPVLVFGALWLVLEVVVTFSSTHLPPSPIVEVMHTPHRAGPVGGWFQWDAQWYESIARDGYWYRAGHQSPVAFFPAFPLAIRLVAVVLRDPAVAGVLISLACGLASFVLLYRWCMLKAPGQARAVVVALGLYPYSWYLFGAVYADALFLAAALATFVALETDRPGWAAISAMVATAARPTGLAIVAALVVAVFIHPRWHRHDAATRPRWFVVIGAGGILAWCTFLRRSFGDAFAFKTVQAAPGWDQPTSLHTWSKVELWRTVRRIPHLFGEVRMGTRPRDHVPVTDLITSAGLVLQTLLVIVVASSIRAVHRRFGMVYSVYVTLVVALPVIGSKDLQGTGRYMLAAFPAFVVVGGALALRPVARTIAAVISGALLLLGTSLFARGYYLS